jgi:hypothetical protein
MPSFPAPRLILLLGLLLAAVDAHAYIDPNTGGLLYQILLPVIIALTAGWRYVRMLCGQLWRRLMGRRDASEPAHGADRGSDRRQDHDDPS